MDKYTDIKDIRIPVDTVGKAGIDRDLMISPEDLERILADQDIKVRSPLRIKYTIMRVDSTIHASISVRGEIHAHCSRCLDPVDYAIDRFFESDYIPAEADMPCDLEAARDNPNLGYYRKEILLGEYIISELIVSLPVRFVCSPSCKGLCPNCGANLNYGPCMCTKPSDPRLDVLKELVDGR